MTAKYKRKRLAEEQSYDSPARHLKLEGAERMAAKKEIREAIIDLDKDSKYKIACELAWEEEMRLSEVCCASERIYGPGWVCTCRTPKPEDYL